jgi:GMP synthase-like glutamine amidotransferase
MDVLVLRHHDEDDPGLIGEEVERRGAKLRVHHVLNDGSIPEAKEYDFCIILGSKSSVYDEGEGDRWIQDELAWIRQANEDGVPLFGICFGAQAISVALGGSVEPAGAWEIGWVSMESTSSSFFAGPWFEYHRDRCLPPPSATVHARNELCIQAFSLDKNLAVQFHPEIERRQLAEWINAGGEGEMRDLGFDVDKILAETKEREPFARANVNALISFFFDTCVTTTSVGSRPTGK